LHWQDYARAGLLAAVMSGVPALILFIPILCGFVTFMSPVLGWIIASAAIDVARQRRGRYLPLVTGAGIALGGLIIAFIAGTRILLADFIGQVAFADMYVAMLGALEHIGLCCLGAWVRFWQFRRR
jgi:hypothetical protein